MSSLIPPTTPYISLADPHMQNYFTKGRIKQHLRRAGLLNKNGHILTETEYESRLMDIEIGGRNQIKYEDALLEVLIELGNEQYKLLCQEMEKIKKQLQFQFGRIQKQYARRINPVKISVMHDGHIESATGSAEFVNEQVPHINTDSALTAQINVPPMPERSRLDEIQNKLEEFIGKMNTLAKINANNTFLLNMPDTIRKLKERQEQLAKQQESWTKDYEDKETKRALAINREFELIRQLIDNSVIDKRKIEQIIQASFTIKDIQENISLTRKQYDAISPGVTQTALKAAITASEQQTMKREGVIEQLTMNIGERVKNLESLFKDTSSKPIPSVKTITRAEVEKLIRESTEHLKPKETNSTSEFLKLIQDLNDRLVKTETALNKLLNSTNTINNNNINKKQPDKQTSIKSESNLKNALPNYSINNEQPSDPSTQEKTILLIEQRLTQIEVRLNASGANKVALDNAVQNVKLVATNAQMSPGKPSTTSKRPELAEKSNESRKPKPKYQLNPTDQAAFRVEKNNKLASDVDQEGHNDNVSGIQAESKNYSDIIQNLQNQIDSLNETKPSHEKVDDLIKLDKQKNEQLINDLRKKLNKHEEDLNKCNADLAALRRKSTLKPAPTAVSLISKSLPTKEYTDDELQAIMPYIEPLPIFPMLIENEWSDTLIGL